MQFFRAVNPLFIYNSHFGAHESHVLGFAMATAMITPPFVYGENKNKTIFSSFSTMFLRVRDIHNCVVSDESLQRYEIQKFQS